MGFYTSNKELVDNIKKYFEGIDANSVVEVLKKVKTRNATIFEIANELLIQVTMNKQIKSQKREFNKLHAITPFEETPEAQRLNKAFFNMLSYYKQSYKDENEDFRINEDKERRRPVKVNFNGIYNYLPIQCSDKSHIEQSTNDLDNCMYSHTENEVKYHPLNYKLRLCKNPNCKDGDYCQDSHNIYEDLRKLHLDNQNSVINGLNYILKENYFDFLNKKSDSDVQPDKFSINTYKINKCPNGKICMTHYHFCYNYHEPKERRRDPRLYKISENSPCKYALFENRWGDPTNCPKVKIIYDHYHREIFAKNSMLKMN